MSRRLLIIRNTALGDVAMTVPVVYALAQQYPDLEIWYLTAPFHSRLFINPPHNLHLLTTDYKGRHHGLRGLMRLVGELRKYRFDYVADFHDVMRSWIISLALRLTGAKVRRLHKSRFKRLTHIFKRQIQQTYISRYAGVLQKLGFPVELDFERLSLPEAPLAVQHPAVGIAPFARYYTKTYPMAQMRQVIKGLIERGCHIYLFGGRGREAEILQQWVEGNDRCVSLAGKYDIESEIAIMSQLDVMVTMDSANHHMASLAGCPAVSIWGGTVPEGGFMAYGQPMSNAICQNLRCQPCSIGGGESCPKGGLECMQAIAPDAVVDKVMQLIKA